MVDGQVVSDRQSSKAGGETGTLRWRGAIFERGRAVGSETGGTESSFPGWGCPGQKADEGQGFAAGWTDWGWSRCGRYQFWRLPIEQGEDALPPVFGGGTEPTEVANALEAFGQDVLEEAAQELCG